MTFSNLAFGGATAVPKAVFFNQATCSSGLDLTHITVTEVSGDENTVIFWTDRQYSGTRIEQSLFSTNQVELCRGPVTSRGNNLFDDDSCGLSSLGDRLVGNIGLLPLDSTLGRIPVHPLNASSPAIDSGPFCDVVYRFSLTRPLDGNGDGLVHCDAGAFEMAPPRGIQGEANGLFFSSDADGHYVFIQQTNATDYLIYWYTFDRIGRQAWVWATGQRQGNVISAKAYISQGGTLEPGSAPTGQEIENWGRVRINLLGCEEAVFSYASTRNEFGSGKFRLERLALVDALGCED